MENNQNDQNTQSTQNIKSTQSTQNNQSNQNKENNKDKKSSITVNVFDLKSGLTTYEKAEYIRITSKDYNLLIMLDYMPIIGEVEGKVDIKLEEEELHFEKIKASYMNSNNVFNLMIQGVISE